MKYYNYKTREYTEENDNVGLSFLYNNFIGRVILKIMTSKIITKIYAKYLNTKISKIKIKKFIKNNNINMDDYIDEEYNSFNDFFKRNIKKEKRKLEKGLIAPCDSKLSVYDITEELKLNVKNSVYTIEELIRDDASSFIGGKALIYRLCVDDYHHYIFPFDGKVLSNKKIPGILHTVQPIALKKYKVFSENSREVTILNTKEYGKVAYIEVGAMMVGKIVNENVKEFKKGDEKGHFEFGGSTVILLYQKDKIKLNKKIEENSNNDIETIVKLGNNLE